MRNRTTEGRRMFFILILCVSLAGCGKLLADDNVRGQKNEKAEFLPENVLEEYREIYTEAENADEWMEIGTREKMAACIGSAGFAVVDMENQINMENPEIMEEFCEKAENGEKVSAFLIQIRKSGELLRIDFAAEEKKLEVRKTALDWQGEKPEIKEADSYEAAFWAYTQKGYLLYEKDLPEGYDGPLGHDAVRIKPLDEKCRAYGLKYLMPIGYKGNNMFLTEWSEEDYGELDFFDLYEPLYQLKYGELLNVSLDTRRVPAESLENVIVSYFRIPADVLREREPFDRETEEYLWHKRGWYEYSFSDMPYPEVTAYRENEDGTLTLVTDAVWAEENLDRAYSHEVTVRLLEDGQWQYVSNHILPSEENRIPAYTARFTEEEWEKYYGDVQKGQ